MCPQESQVGVHVLQHGRSFGRQDEFSIRVGVRRRRDSAILQQPGLLVDHWWPRKFPVRKINPQHLNVGCWVCNAMVAYVASAPSTLHPSLQSDDRMYVTVVRVGIYPF